MLSPLHGCVVSHGERVLQQHRLNYTAVFLCCGLRGLPPPYSENHASDGKSQTRSFYLPVSPPLRQNRKRCVRTMETCCVTAECWEEAKLKGLLFEFSNFYIIYLRAFCDDQTKRGKKMYFRPCFSGFLLALQPLSTSSIKSIQSTSFHLLHFAQSTIGCLINMSSCITTFHFPPCFYLD